MYESSLLLFFPSSYFYSFLTFCSFFIPLFLSSLLHIYLGLYEGSPLPFLPSLPFYFFLIYCSFFTFSSLPTLLQGCLDLYEGFLLLFLPSLFSYFFFTFVPFSLSRFFLPRPFVFSFPIFSFLFPCSFLPRNGVV